MAAERRALSQNDSAPATSSSLSATLETSGSCANLTFSASSKLEQPGVAKVGMRIREWYAGEYVVYENDPNSALVFIGGDYRRHWTANVAACWYRSG
jgi:hypothetical protein